MGRPREHDRNAIAEELIDWAEKEDSVNLSKFCAHKYLKRAKLSEWAKEDEYFATCLDIAKAFLTYRREEYLTSNKLHVKGYDLCLATYDYFVAETRREQAKYEAELKKQTDNVVSEDIKKMFENTMNQLASLQSERKIVMSNINNEEKS